MPGFWKAEEEKRLAIRNCPRVGGVQMRRHISIIICPQIRHKHTPAQQRQGHVRLCAAVKNVNHVPLQPSSQMSFSVSKCGQGVVVARHQITMSVMGKVGVPGHSRCGGCNRHNKVNTQQSPFQRKGAEDRGLL